MRGGVVGIEVGAIGAMPAPVSGIEFGRGDDGRTVSLRLFRLGGARVALAAPVLPAQLIAVRVAAAGTPVQVVTGRPPSWEPLLGHDRALHVVSASEVRHGAGGPSLLIDDRPTAAGSSSARGPVELHPWQCRLEVRTQWLPSEVGAFSRADLAVFAAVPREITPSLATSFAVPLESVEALSLVDAYTFGVVSRGLIDYVTLEPTPQERRVLDAARLSW